MTEGQTNMYEGLKIFVAVPTHDKKLCINCHQSLMNALQVLLACKIPFQFDYEVGLPYISMARNNLVRKFLASDCTDMVFIDSDVGFAPGAFHDLIISREDLIGGAYPKKQDSEEYAVSLAKNENSEVILHKGVIAAEGLATGFMKVKRSVFERMQEAYPELEYDDGITGKKTFNFFGEFKLGNRMFYDDFGFCHLWRQLGGDMWVLPNITFTHAGSKDYKGNLHEHLTRPRPQGVINALKVDGFMSEEELTWLFNQAQQMGSVIEIGSWKGRSTTALLEGCKGPVLAVDNWSGHDPASNGALEKMAVEEDVYGQFKRNTQEYKNLTVMRGLSPVVGRAWDRSADMVFIDGEHTYEGCKADIEAWSGRAKKLIAFHDYSAAWPGIMRAVNEKYGIPKVVGTIAYIELGDKENV